MADKRSTAARPPSGAVPNKTPSSASVSRDALLPPPKERLGSGFMIALAVHVALVAAIAVGVSWKVSAPDSVEAELWSATAVQAAPRAATPPPAPQPVPPTPVPETPPPPPPPPRVEPAKVAPPPPAPVVDPQIAIEKEKQRRAEARREEQEEKEAERKALIERRKQDQAKLAQAQAEAQVKAEAQAKAKALADAQAQAQAQAQAEKREAAEKQAKADAARKQADAKTAAALEAQRKANLDRMLAQAGGSGDARSTGTAAQSSGPSAGYGGRIRARVKPNIIFSDEVSGNPVAEVEVRAAPDGTIIGKRLSRSSGIPAWDDAVLRAIDRTGTLPQDVDGRVPSSLVISFRPRDL